ncbi:Glycoside hydrolase, family 61 [Pleurostoma richardsiae]|uniref:lytic cellulose monooxygenase (C4-dehydrogenating) n=1 Tax=Pleurostoma richardsiae TaxID=41990 RepID=A0AA38VVS6_9PEZI|nr:Glycoside hydrolase, family 61 [Pleurostoma richardsiae]
MASFRVTAALIGTLLSAGQASAHGIATAMVVFPTGTFLRGYNPSYQYENPPPKVIGWSTPNDLQNTFVDPTKYSNPDIICHLGATPAALEAPINAGDVLEIQWTPWPASHKGPVLDYLAKCDGPCTNVDKAKLKFFKIQEVGLVDAATDVWGASELTNNNNSWLVRIPTDIAPGNYVLRHEIIALHAANSLYGAQNYPFCFSLAISSSGTSQPAGVLGTDLYKANDPGIHFTLFNKLSTYDIPGPTLYSGALPVSQSKPAAIKASATGVASLAVPAAAPKPTVAASMAAAGDAPSPVVPVRRRIPVPTVY